MAAIAQVRSSADWHGTQLVHDPAWRLSLGAADRAEVMAALGVAEAAGVRLDDVSPRSFPLPRLGPLLRRLAADVTHGRGFALVDGAPVDPRSAADGLIWTHAAVSAQVSESVHRQKR